MNPSTEPPGKRTLFRGKLWFWVTIPPLLALDLWSKAATFAFLAEEYPLKGKYSRHHTIFETDPLKLRLVSWENTGTIWGLGRDYTSVLIGLRFAALGVIVYYVTRLPSTARRYLFVLGLIMAGALGNLYDNCTQDKSGVRDFLFFTGSWPWEWRFPAFNVADSCICVGAIALAIMMWRADESPPRPEAAA